MSDDDNKIRRNRELSRCLTIQLLEKCNLNCNFCFAKKESEVMLSMEDFQLILNFCKKSNVDEIEFTGGEPFLHPKVREYILLVREFKRIFIISNFTIKDCIKNLFSDSEIDARKISFSVNFNRYVGEQYINFMENLECAVKSGAKVVLGRTFVKAPFYLDDLVGLSIEYNLPIIRISVSNPSLGIVENEWTKQKDFQEFCSFLKRYIQTGKNKGKQFRWGCAIAPCFAKEEDVCFLEQNGVLNCICRTHLGVTANLEIGHCYIMQDNLKKLNEFADYDDAKRYIEQCFYSLKSEIIRKNYCQNCKRKVENDICGCIGQWKK